MTTKPLYPKLNYDSNGRQYRITAYTVSRNYSIGDAGFVELEFPIIIIDKIRNMVCMEVTYNILETSFDTKVSVDKVDKRQDTIDYIVSLEGSFVEPNPPKADLVLKLLDKLMKYLEANKK